MSRAALDQLLGYLIQAAQSLQKKNGAFYPIGVALDRDNNIVPTGVWEGDENPPSAKVIAMLEALFSEQALAGNIRAAGICFDASVTPPGASKTDAIQIGLEHADGTAFEVYVPYKRGFWKGFQYGEVFASTRTPRFFVSPEKKNSP